MSCRGSPPTFRSDDEVHAIPAIRREQLGVITLEKIFPRENFIELSRLRRATSTAHVALLAVSASLELNRIFGPERS